VVDASRVALSIVVDAQPKFQQQAFTWFVTLTQLAGREPSSLFVHCLPGVPVHFKERMAARRARVLEVEPFETGHRYCNKIQAMDSTRFEGYDYVVFNDCDLAYSAWFESPFAAPFYGRVVDRPNPPLPILRALFGLRGLPLPETIPVGVPLASDTDPHTVRGNCNGGMYVVRKDQIAPLSAAWRRNARWCWEHRSVFESYHPHIDQVSMAMALQELGIAPEILGAECNCPTHLPVESLQLERAPVAIHYHDRLDKDGYLVRTGLPRVDGAIERVNAALEAAKRLDFDNSTFWNYRYQLFPEIGSGIGSRNEYLSLKEATLRPFARVFTSAIDHGCGDLEVSRNLPFHAYTGVDVSDEALRIAASKRPDWRFLKADDAGSETAEMSLCLDVLIHQSSFDRYRAVLAGAVEAATEIAFISGYEKPLATGGMIFFHEPLSKTLLAHADVARIEPLTTYRDTTLFAVVKRRGLLADLPADVAISDFVSEAAWIAERLPRSHSMKVLALCGAKSAGEVLVSRSDDRCERATFGNLEWDVAFDGSVVAHRIDAMKSRERKRLFDAAGRGLRRNGKLVLTFQLHPGTEFLWNLGRGEAVDWPWAHGSLSGVLAELERRFRVVQQITLGAGTPANRRVVCIEAIRR
jgi:hypothetical protein